MENELMILIAINLGTLAAVVYTLRVVNLHNQKMYQLLQRKNGRDEKDE